MLYYNILRCWRRKVIIIRDVFEAKYGKGDELVALVKEGRSPFGYGNRVLTDLSGRFFTVVVETEADSLAHFEQLRTQWFSKPDFAGWFARMEPMVRSGRREFYNVES
jgi:hypothetical protein